LLTDSDTPPCSDQPGESNATNAKVAVAIAAVLKAIFMLFLHYSSFPVSNPALSLLAGIAIDQGSARLAILARSNDAPWGVVPVHLNELSPDTARGTFPGFVYQLGNLLASVNATLQAGIASHFGGNYGLALAVVAGSVAIVIAVLTAAGTEAKGVVFTKAKAVAA
jgi:hypothetical protein